MNRDISNQGLSEEYQSVESKLERLRVASVDQLHILFERNSIHLGFPIQSRTKTLESIREKVASGRYSLKKSIFEFQDLVGVRIILLFKRDVTSLINILESHLNVIKKYDTSEKLKDDQFGYSSLHYVVTIPEGWLTVPTFEGLGGINVEIQIRTLSQHTWAEASRTLQYNTDSKSISRIFVYGLRCQNHPNH